MMTLHERTSPTVLRFTGTLLALPLLVAVVAACSTTAPGGEPVRPTSTVGTDTGATGDIRPGHGALEGTVVDATGAPVADCFLDRTLLEAASDLADPEIAVLTDADGAFRVTLPPGAWRFVVTCAEPPVAQEVRLVAGDSSRLDIELP